MSTPGELVSLRDADLGAGDRPVLHGINLTVNAGELVGILGPSGAGKSTLLAALAGDDVIHRGDVTIAGTSPRETRVGFVPQLSDETESPLCAEEIVSLGRVRRGLATRRNELADVRTLLENLELGGLGRRRLGELSGGQRQRIAIARALHASATLLLCDEPTSGADPALSRDLIDTLAAVSRTGTTVLIATHDLGVVVPALERVIGINHGRIVFDGHPTDLNRHTLDIIYGRAIHGRSVHGKAVTQGPAA